MRFTAIDPPRVFEVGHGGRTQMKDCGRLELQPDEQVTFVTESGAEYDVARKSWGYYATPSLNGRLRAHGFKTALVRSSVSGGYFVLLVELLRVREFQAYVGTENLSLIEWLDERS